MTGHTPYGKNTSSSTDRRDSLKGFIMNLSLYISARIVFSSIDLKYTVFAQILDKTVEFPDTIDQR